MADRQLNSFRMNYCRILSSFFDFLSCLVEMWFISEIWLAEIRVIRLKIATVTTTVFCCFAQFVFGIFTREAKNCYVKYKNSAKKTHKQEIGNVIWMFLSEQFLHSKVMPKSKVFLRRINAIKCVNQKIGSLKIRKSEIRSKKRCLDFQFGNTRILFPLLLQKTDRPKARQNAFPPF